MTSRSRSCGRSGCARRSSCRPRSSAERRLYWWERIAVVLAARRARSATLTYPRPIDVEPRDPRAQSQLTDLIKNTPDLDVERFLDELYAAFGVEWNRSRSRRSTPTNLVMTWDHVRALARAGMDIESHSRRHRVLQTLPEAELRDELEGSRTDLEAAARPPGARDRLSRRPPHRAPTRVSARRSRRPATGSASRTRAASTRIWPLRSAA